MLSISSRTSLSPSATSHRSSASLFTFGLGSGGPRYLWLLPIVVIGQMFVALVFAELGSHYPIAGASLIARMRGWDPRGAFRLGAWAYPVTFAGIVWLGAMLVNILIPSGITSPRGVLFNYDWMTLLVMVVIIAIGAVYSIVSRPARRIPVAAPAPAEAAI